MKNKSLLILVGGYICLTGFYHSHEKNAKQYVQEQQAAISKNFRIKLSPIPEIQKPQKITLVSGDKDPFAVKDFVISTNKDVDINLLECQQNPCGDEPPVKHQPYALEQYALENLQMVGTVKKVDGNFVALIQTPDAMVVNAEIGSYIGTNNGLIQNITESKITIQEKVQFSNGWRNREAIINLRD